MYRCKVINTEVCESQLYFLFLFQAKSTIHKAVYATVTVTIVDVNDNSPKFIGAPYRGTVPENSPNGLTVLRVTAQDADAVRTHDIP